MSTHNHPPCEPCGTCHLCDWCVCDDLNAFVVVGVVVVVVDYNMSNKYKI